MLQHETLYAAEVTLEENKIKEIDPKDSDKPREAAILRNKQHSPAHDIDKQVGRSSQTSKSWPKVKKEQTSIP